jgi:indole-3-glycerol phosphate synthase
MINRILETKREEINALKNIKYEARKKPVLSLNFDGNINIIAELKQKSPSAGFIGKIDDARIEIYSRYAKGISILTDSTYFGGSFELLKEVAGKTHLPILCKDFIIDESQIDMAYWMGADIILLIVRILDKERLETLYSYTKRLGMNCLVEIHKKEEFDKVAYLDPEIIGVNARDLDTLEINFDMAEEMLSYVDAPVRIAESGIKSRKDIERFKNANGFLVGETLMKSQNLESTFRELLYG